MRHKPTRIGILNGWPVFKDHNGDLVVECDGFQNLRYLSDEEEKRLLRVSRQLKNLVVTGEHSEDSEDSEAL